MERSTYGAKRKMIGYKLKQELVPLETEITEQGPVKLTYDEPTYELLIELGPDHTARLIIPADAMTALPDVFEELPRQQD